MMCRDQGKYKEAAILLNEALTIREGTLGMDHLAVCYPDCNYHSSEFYMYTTSRVWQVLTRNQSIKVIHHAHNIQKQNRAFFAQNEIYDIFSMFNDNLFALNHSDNAAIS